MFGAACDAAGLRLSTRANGWTDEQVAADLAEVAEQLSRPPILADMSRPPPRISTYRFGSWAAAVEALHDPERRLLVFR